MSSIRFGNDKKKAGAPPPASSLSTHLFLWIYSPRTYMGDDTLESPNRSRET